MSLKLLLKKELLNKQRVIENSVLHKIVFLNGENTQKCRSYLRIKLNYLLTQKNKDRLVMLLKNGAKERE